MSNVVATRQVVSIAVLAVLGISASPAATTPPANPPVRPADAAPTWDLSASYPDDASWNRAVAEVREGLARFAQRQGEIGNAGELADRLDERRLLRGRAGNLARFALLNASIDGTDLRSRAKVEAATALETDVEGAVAWLDEVILRRGAEGLAAWSRTEPRIRRHGWSLSQTLVQQKHTLPEGTGPAYAALERSLHSSGPIYDQLLQSDLGWPTVAGEDGHPVVVNASSFPLLSQSRTTSVRRAAVTAYFGKLKALAGAFGLLFTRHLEVDTQLARARGLRDGLDAFFLLSDGVPPGTYVKMVEAGRSSRASAVKYARTVARLHRIADLRYADLNVQAPPFGRPLPLPVEREILVPSLEPLGASYQRLVRERLALPWFDLVERPHKNRGSSGVYWQVGGGHPYVLLSYGDDLQSARGLAGAVALLNFYADIPPDKAPERREYDFPIYGNTVWFLGQMLQYDYLAAHGTREERIAVLAQDLYRLWSLYFGGVVATDFESRLSQQIAAGSPPVGTQISDLYLATLRSFYGGDGGPALDEIDGQEWMTLGNLFYTHVFTEWAFAMATAVALAERVESGDARTIEALTHPMAREGTYLSYDLLKDAGADPGLPSTYEAIIRRMERLTALLEKELP